MGGPGAQREVNSTPDSIAAATPRSWRVSGQGDTCGPDKTDWLLQVSARAGAGGAVPQTLHMPISHNTDVPQAMLPTQQCP